MEIAWRKSSYSDATGNGNCMEIAMVADAVAIRDSKNAAGPTLGFPTVAWRTFLRTTD